MSGWMGLRKAAFLSACCKRDSIERLLIVYKMCCWRKWLIHWTKIQLVLVQKRFSIWLPHQCLVVDAVADPGRPLRRRLRRRSWRSPSSWRCARRGSASAPASHAASCPTWKYSLLKSFSIFVLIWWVPLACRRILNPQDDTSGQLKPPVDLDSGCSAILPGQ